MTKIDYANEKRPADMAKLHQAANELAAMLAIGWLVSIVAMFLLAGRV